MKLYIKQKPFSWNDKFTVKDENSVDVYFVKGEILSFGKKLHIYDRYNNEAAFVKQKMLTFMPKFEIFKDGLSVGEIQKRFTLFKQQYTVTGIDWHIHGDFFSHSFTISDNRGTVARISKEWFTWGDSYALDVRDASDSVTALAAVLVIDCINEASANTTAINNTLNN